MNHLAQALFAELDLNLGASGASITRATVTPIVADPEGFARAFYGALFERAPGLRTLFPEDIGPQGFKLAQTLCFLVSAQDQSQRLVPVLRELGRRHHGYGARPFHYRVVGEVLVETLAVLNGPAFTAEAREAWQVLYGFVAREMQAGGAGAEDEVRVRE